MNPYDEWTYIFTEDAQEMLESFGQDKPKAVAYDTETTGLHIIKDKPFLIQLGWGRKVFLFYPTDRLMTVFFDICSSVKWVYGANIGYDCHMLTNIGYGKQVERMDNLCDIQAVMRLALEAKSTRDGGDRLGLTYLGAKYIHPYASHSEDLIKKDLKRVRDDQTKVLATMLRQIPIVGQLTATGRQQYWGKGAIEKFMKNITHTLDDLPEDVRELWEDWQDEYPEPTYEDIDRELMLQYGGEDVATTLMLAEFGMEIVINREQLTILQLERNCILPTYRMERVGFKVDQMYLEESRIKMKDYIAEQRKELWELVGEEITVNQSARIMQIFEEKFHITLESSDKKEMKLIQNNFEGEPKRFAQLIGTLRSAEKWYSTYILGVQKNASWDGRAYTQINLNGAVSGRMSSNFQQFPRGAFKTLEGEELYHPRKAFLVDGGEYPELAFIDFSQIELRAQGHYTILASGGDINLCRAYMPFKCMHKRTGKLYDYKTEEGRAKWDEKDEKGYSVWTTEQGLPWTPTDLHSMTASKAYPHIPMDSAEFRFPNGPRDKGKTTNFASNYGAGPMALVDSLGISVQEAERLINGYKEAFPMVIEYQQKIQKAHLAKGYVHNHYGRMYYLRNNRDAYKLANYVVQGTCADALKKALIEVDTLLLGKKSKMVLPIHDELIFTIHETEMYLKEELAAIMNKAFDWCLLPVSVGVDATTTNWSEAE